MKEIASDAARIAPELIQLHEKTTATIGSIARKGYKRLTRLAGDSLPLRYSWPVGLDPNPEWYGITSNLIADYSWANKTLRAEGCPPLPGTDKYHVMETATAKGEKCYSGSIARVVPVRLYLPYGPKGIEASICEKRQGTELGQEHDSYDNERTFTIAKDGTTWDRGYLEERRRFGRLVETVATEAEAEPRHDLARRNSDALAIATVVTGALKAAHDIEFPEAASLPDLLDEWHNVSDAGISPGFLPYLQTS